MDNQVPLGQPSRHDAESHFRRGKTCLLEMDYQQAVSELSRAIDLDPQHAAAYFYRHIAYKQMGKETEIWEADMFRAIDLDQNYNYVNYFSRRVDEVRTAQLVNLLNRAVEANLDDPEIYLRRGQALMSQGKYDLALLDFSRALQVNTGYDQAYIYRGMVYGVLGQFSQAIADFDRAIALNTHDPLAYYNRGVARTQMAGAAQSNTQAAIGDYTRAIELKPDYSDAIYNRATLYIESGELYKALDDLNRLIAVAPGFPAAYGNRGVLHGRLGKHEQALVDFNRVIELNPKDVLAYYNRGYNYAMLDKHNQAIEEFNHALELNYRNREIYYWRGISYYNTGEFEKAYQDLFLCVTSEAQVPMKAFNLISILEKLLGKKVQIRPQEVVTELYQFGLDRP